MYSIQEGLGYITTTVDYCHSNVRHTKIGENFFVELNECVELRYYHIWSLCQQQKKRIGRRIPQIMLLTRAHSDSFWSVCGLSIVSDSIQIGEKHQPNVMLVLVCVAWPLHSTWRRRSIFYVGWKNALVLTVVSHTLQFHTLCSVECQGVSCWGWSPMRMMNWIFFLLN